MKNISQFTKQIYNVNIIKYYHKILRYKIVT